MRDRGRRPASERAARGVASLLALALLLAAACGPAPGTRAASVTAEASPPTGTGTRSVAPPEVAPLAATPPAPAPGVGSLAEAGPGASVSPTTPPPAEHDGERALEHVRALAERIGPRVAGTPGETAALQYIQERLASWGYYVERFPFTFPDPFRQGSVRVEDEQLAAWPLAGSAAGRVSGAAVEVGLARAEDLAGLDLGGKVAVAQRGVIRFGEKLDNVQAAGALALVVVNSQPGPFLGALGHEAGIPVVGVRGVDGPRLLAAARAGQRVRVDAPGGEPSESATVLASRAPGARCEVLVGGHHDSVPGAPGANDNASGTANVLELARAFAADGLDEGLCFATFGAEESGLHGSRALVARFQAEGALPRAMVNLDVTGSGSEVELIGSAELVARAAELAARYGIPARVAEMPAFSGSDHQSFASAGVPVLYLTSGDFGAIHTPEDTVDGVQAEALDRVGDLAYAAVAELLNE